MRSSAKHQTNNGPDIVTPLAELLEFLIKALAKGLEMLFKFIYRKYILKSFPIEKIKRESLLCKKKTLNPEALGMDCSNKKELLLKDINFRRHSFIVGASGFGKTNLISILQEHSLKSGKPILFIDPKGDFEAQTTFKNLCNKYGKTCYIFSEARADSVCLNPILEGTVNQVADRIMRSFDWSEQFYKDCAYRVLVKVLRELEKENQEFSLKNIHTLLLAKYDTSENSGLITKIELILESDFGRLLNAGKEGLTFSKIREQRACLYIGLSTQAYGETAISIGKLFLEELLYNSYMTLRDEESLTKGLKNPISANFDEFGAIVTTQFIELQNKCRGAGIELTMAVQSTSDIDRVNPDLTKQIVENAGNIFVMKQRLQDGASFFSEAIGTIVSQKLTYQTDDGDESGKGTMREANELICHPDIIKNLKVGQCVLLRHDPSKVNLINLRERTKEEVKAEAIKEVKSQGVNGALKKEEVIGKYHASQLTQA